MIRNMTVSYAPGANDRTPMIRITNRFLVKSGFTVGGKVFVVYAPGVITISLKKKKHELSI